MKISNPFYSFYAIFFALAMLNAPPRQQWRMQAKRDLRRQDTATSHRNTKPPRNITSTPKDNGIYSLENAQKILPNFYGQRFRGSQSETNCNTSKTKRTEQEFDVLLMGFCEKNDPGSPLLRTRRKKACPTTDRSF